MKTKITLSLIMIITLGVSKVFSQDSWIRIGDFTPGKIGRAGAIAVTINDKAYAGLGVSQAAPENFDGYYNDFWEFDGITNSWQQKATFPGQPRQAAIAFSADGRAYVGTGITNRSAFSDIYEYNPVENTWRRVADYPGGPRYIAMAFGIGNKGYVGGGKDQNFVYGTVDFYEFDPAIGETGTWTRKADIGSIRRSTGVGFNIGEKGYIGLGLQDYDTRLADLWEYDPAIDVWTRKADFPTSPELGYGRWGAVAFSIADKAYVGQGYYYEPHGDMWEYNPANDTWTEKTPLNSEGRGQGIGFSLGNHGYVGLGYNNSPDYLNDIWQFTPTGDTEITCIEPQQLCWDSTNTYTIPPISISSTCQSLDITYTITGATSRTGTGINASGQFNPGTSTITWQVTDCNGKTLSCSSIVEISKIVVTVADRFAVNPGGEVNTIYKGYGPASLTYNASVTGGMPFDDGTYTYLWSTGSTTNSTTVAPTIPGKYTYTLTVTDKLNCSATHSVTVNVVDVRCGWRLEKVQACVPLPRGKSLNVCVHPAAVKILLKYGATLGVCEDNNLADVPGEVTVSIFPNPNKGVFVVSVNNLPSGQCDVKVLNRDGKIIDSKSVTSEGDPLTILFELSPVHKGLHVVKVSTIEGVKTFKIFID